MIERTPAPDDRGLRPGVGIGLALLTATISGVAVWVNATAVRTFEDPVLFTTLKNGVAAVALLALAVTTVDRLPTRLRATTARQRLGLAALGVIGGSVPFVLFFSGLAAASAPSAAIIHKTLFVWVALLAVVLLRERLGPLQVGALGVLLVAQLLVRPTDGLAWSAGETMIALATGLWAVEVIVARRLLSGIPAAVAAAARMGIGLVVLVAWVGATGGLNGIAGLGLSQWAWVLVTGGLLTGYVATWYAALRRAPASTVTAVLTIGAPITAVVQLVADGRVPAPSALVGYGGIVMAVAALAWLAVDGRVGRIRRAEARRTT